MKSTRKILIALLAVFTLLLSMTTLFVSADSQPEYLYLTPNANWKVDNARFAAYFFGNGDTWVSMTDSNGDGVYEVKVPTDKVYPNVIFCRMNSSAAANNWNNKWNQTADLVIPTSGANHYTVKEGTWDKGGGTWSTFGSTCTHANLGPVATCTTPQQCLDCKDPVVSALGHTYNSAHLCTRCNEQASFTVAGTGAHLGTEWDTGNKENDMTFADGVYTKVYTNVAAGSYLLKVARDHDWGTAYPDADKAYSVAKAGSTVTVTLKGTTVDIKVEDPSVEPDPDHQHNFVDGKCECGEKDPNYVDPKPEATDYYLIGFINGANYGCDDDYATIGDYKFIDGSLTVSFESADNYVFVKTGDNSKWYMSKSYCTDTTVTLAETSTGTSEKLYVPGGVQIVFTLVINDDGTLTLNYALPEIPVDPDHQHSFVDGKCECGESDPDYVAPETVYIIAGDVMQLDGGIYVEGINPFGTNWDVTNESNMLVYDENLGCYVKVYKDVFAGEYQFKVAENKSWDVSYGVNGGQENCYFKVESDGSTVTITFKDGVPSVTVEAIEHNHNFVDSKCECGESDPGYIPPVEDDEKPEGETPADPQPDDSTGEEVELNLFQKIIKAITDFFAKIGDWFKNLFSKK